MQALAPRLAMVAGEPSGDLLAGLLLGGLNERWPGLKVAGIGGSHMTAQGFDAWWPYDKLAIHGHLEALMHYRELLALRNALAARLIADPPEAFIGVDAPDFNLGLEAQLKSRGVKAIHFVSPSIWAWRGGRIDKIAKSVDHMLCMFPFEPELYERKGIPASYVGHPLADAIPLVPPRAAGRQALGIGDEQPVIALLPGSRRAELKNIAPLFLDAAAEMHRQRPGLQFLLPIVPGMRALVEPMVASHPGLPLRVLEGQSHEVLTACDVTLIASGTATLEAALFKRPMVIAYRVPALSFQLMKRLRYQPWVGLPNILSNDFVVPELLQNDATPAALARETLAWLDDRPRVERLKERFEAMHLSLRRDTARTATDAIAKVLGR